MRRTNAIAAVGKVNIPAPLSKEFALLALMLVATLWVGYVFAQEALLNHGLNAKAADLRRQNATIAAQNVAYQRDLAVGSTGSAADEDARAHGYARNDERVYVVNRPAATASAATAKPAEPVARVSGSVGRSDSLWRWLGNLWHR